MTNGRHRETGPENDASDGEKAGKPESTEALSYVGALCKGSFAAFPTACAIPASDGAFARICGIVKSGEVSAPAVLAVTCVQTSTLA